MNKKNIKNIIIIILIVIVVILTLIIILKHNEDKLLKNNLEIEKKWLIKTENIPYNLSNCEKHKIEQTYISFSPEIRIRNIDNNIYVLTIKSDTPIKGLVRNEHECFITKEEYEKLLSKKEGNTIYKTRYTINDNKNQMEIDIFSNNLKGLAYLEIEFKNVEDAKNFKAPNWVIKDVTTDPLYKNGYLARFGIPNSYFEYIK